MKKIYYLKTCDTCKRILKTINNIEQFDLQEIKSNPLTEKNLEQLYKLAKSYEALFNKRAQLYKERDLKNKQLNETHYKQLLLEHYTFLARPVIIYDNDVFIGNSAKVVNLMVEKVNS